MITVKLSDELHEDIVFYHSNDFAYEDEEMEEDFSPECISFINKAMQAKSYQHGETRTYEMKATPEELSAVIDEVIQTWINRYEDEAKHLSPEDRKQFHTVIRKYRKFIQQYNNEGKKI
jgi:uncharacterized protein YacL (UPF0231 family)